MKRWSRIKLIGAVYRLLRDGIPRVYFSEFKLALKPPPSARCKFTRSLRARSADFRKLDLRCKVFSRRVVEW